MSGRSGDLKTAAQSIQEDGFFILPEVFGGEEMLALANELALLPDRPSRAGIRHLLGHPTVENLATDPRLLCFARNILGPAACPFRATLFDKSPRSNWLIPWHQDTALPLQEKREARGWNSWSVKDQILYAHAPANALAHILAIRVHLDDSVTENGPLRVLPGSHRSGVLSDDAILDLANREKAVSCAVRKGGILAMKPLLVHASSKSRSLVRRRVLHLEYASTRYFPGGICLAMA